MNDGTLKTNSRNVYEINGEVFKNKKSFEAAGGKEKDIKKGVGEEIKGILYLTNKLITRQATTEVMLEAGLDFQASMLRLLDGSPSKSYAVSGKQPRSVKETLADLNVKFLS